MFIKEGDHEYLVKLYESLDAQTRERFLARLLKEAGARAGQDLREAIQVVTEQILNERAVAPNEWVTRTLIKKVYKEIKGQQA